MYAVVFHHLLLCSPALPAEYLIFQTLHLPANFGRLQIPEH
jgi:hypothetical protein